MAHTHGHEDTENYFLDQIFTIALCGALGAIAVLLYVRRVMLMLILNERFHPYVLAGGIVLLMLVAIRAVAVWRLAGQAHSHEHHGHEHHHHAHDHDHHHAHDHDHTHAHDHDLHHEHQHEHSHDHGHDHGWSPWRYTVLMLPVVLYFLNLPSEGFSARGHKQDFEERNPGQMEASTVALLATSGGPGPLLAAGALFPGRQDLLGGGVVRYVPPHRRDLPFSQLERAAFDPEARRELQGKSVTLIGKFVTTGDPNQFSLVRYKRNCCAADAVPLNAVLMVNPEWKGDPLDVRARQQKWVEVTGRIHFFRRRGRADEFIPAVILYPDEKHAPNSLVEKINQPNDPYSR